MKSSLPHLQLELDKLKACIHCGMCLPACPTYKVTGSEAESPRGRLYLMKKLLENELPPDAVQPHLDQCLACHACESVCPSGVQYGRVLLGTREDLARQNFSLKRFFKRAIFRWVLPRHLLLTAFGALLRFYQKSGLQALVRKSGLLNEIPPMAWQESLLPPVPRHRTLHAGMSFGNPEGEHVALLTGCVMDVFYNDIHWDTVEVLVANGYYVRIPEQTCCGALAHHAGETDITRTLARKNIDRILKDNPHWIVLNSAGCGSTLKEYGELLAEDAAYARRAKLFSEKVLDITELLAKKPLAPVNRVLHETVTYHAACHLHHVQKVKTEPVALLAGLPGLMLVPLPDAEACCGSAGVYNIEHAELSREILAAKIDHLRQVCDANGVTTVVTGNPGCLLQLAKGCAEAGLNLRVCHPISVLAQAYRKGDNS